MEKAQEKMEAAVGSISIAVAFPPEFVGEVREPEVSLSFRPKTVEEFERILDVCGGAKAFRFPKRESYYDSPAYLDRDAGQIAVILYPVPRAAAGIEEQAAEPVPHPFFAKYAAGAAGA